MDWHLLGLSFMVVFLAELGDKSQLAAITLSGNCRHPRAIFWGTSTALIFASLLGVLLGQGVGQLLPTHLMKAISAIGFALLGISFLWSSTENIS
jgi:putative Ca2+/H+ antiporter (TMEM165/GDT1 family)